MSEAGTAEPKQRASGAIRRALRHPGFRLLSCAITVSELGTWTYQIAYVAYIYSATHSTAWIALASLARMIPVIVLQPLAGALADRMDRRLLLVLSDLVRGGIMVAIAVAAAAEAPPLVVVLIATGSVLTGLAYQPAINAELPLILGEEDLAAGNTLMGFIWNVTMFAGPAVSGVLLAVSSPTVAFVVNAVSYFLSAILVALALPRRQQAVEGPDAQESSSLLREALDGAGVLFKDVSRRSVAVMCLCDYFVFGAMSILLVAVSEERLHAGGHGLGWLFAAFGIGGTLAVLIATRVADSNRAASGLFIASCFAGVALALLGLVSSTPLAIALLIFAGVASNTVDVSGGTVLQRVTPRDALGRVFGTFDALNYVVTISGSLIAPALVALIGLRGALLVIGLAVPVLASPLLAGLRAADTANRVAASGIHARAGLLASTALLAATPAAALERLAGMATTVDVPAGHVVVHEGDTADDVYVVVDGDLDVSVSTRPDVVRRLSAGDAFGEIGVVTGQTRTATVTATAPTKLLRIPGDDFVDCVRAAPPLAQAVGGVVASRLSTTRRRDGRQGAPVTVT